MVKGTVAADSLTIAKVSVNRMLQLPTIEVLAAYTNSETGATHGWVDGAGVQWSKETRQALEQLFACLAADIANVHLVKDTISNESAQDTPSASTGLRIPSGGIGEFLGAGNDDAQSI